MSKPKLKISCEAKNKKAVIRLDGYITNWSNHAAGFKAQLDKLISDGITDAEIYINSGGGSCFEANEIANELLRFAGSKVARIGALCASAATYIACKCDRVIAARNMSYMIHKPMVFTEGNSDEIESQLKLLKNLEAEYSKTYSEKTGMKVEKIEALWKSDYWMNADEAKTLGFVDEVEGDAEITPDDILAIKACGYKNVPELTATVTQEENLNLNTIMKNQLITVLALAATVSDAQLVAHIEGLKAKAAKADELEQRVNQLTAEVLNDKVKSVLDLAEDKKQITASQRAFYKKQLENNFDETKAHIESLPVAVQLSKETKGTSETQEDRSNWTYADYQEKDPKALAELAEKDEAKFEQLFNAHYNN